MKLLSADLNHLGLLRKRENILARRLSKAKEERERHEREVFDRLEDEGYEANDSHVKLAGVSYSPQRTTYAEVRDKAKLIAHLRENDSGLIDEKLRKAELNQLVREKLDNNEELPPGLGYFDKTWVSTKGVNTKQEADDG